MTEKEIQIINKEEYLDEESTDQKIIFDYNIFDQIKGKELDLNVDKIFSIPVIRNLFKRQKEEYYVVSQKEHVIDCKYIQRKAKIPLISRRIINKEIQNLKVRDPIKYVHLGGTEILIKACFREGIDTPIEIYLADDRIIEPIEKSIISAVKGNLIYQKFKFIISANYSVAVSDKNIDKSLVLYWKMSGIELSPGSKIFTARCKNLYVLTTKHKITAKNKINRIKIENPFEKIVILIDKNEYSYKEIDFDEDLEIVKERLSISKRIDYEPRLSISGNKKYESTSINYEPEIQESSTKLIKHQKEELKQYYITGIINQQKCLILVDIGQEENNIAQELVMNDKIKVKNQSCPDLPKTLVNTKEIVKKEIIIGGIPIKIKFEIYQEKNIILGIKWLEKMKPYSIENKQLIITHENKRIIIKRV